MAATIKDIRSETGLGLATISKYLNGGNVRAENRKKIEDAIRKLDYHPNEVARGLVTRKTRTVGFVINNIAMEFSGVLLQYASAWFHERGYGMMICDSDRDVKQEAENIRFCIEKQVDGILVLPLSQSAGFLAPARKEGVPVVLLDRELSDGHSDCVIIDNRNAAERATDYLIERGHRDIAVIHSDEYTGRLRYEGYLASLEKHGIQARKQYERSGPLHSTELGYQSMKEFLAMKNRPTAVLMSNYEVNLGVVMALNEKGVRCPDEISLLGFDDLILPRVMRPRLTLVAQPMEEIASEGARLLLRRIEEGGDFPPQKVTLYAALREGESVKHLK